MNLVCSSPSRHILTQGDHYMHLADLKSYLDADHRLLALYADTQGWARKAILNIAASGQFSSDRTISQYASEIWGVTACPVVSQFRFIPGDYVQEN